VFSPKQIAQITSGKILKARNTGVTRAVHDSRVIKPGDLFIAIKGNRVDGHAFLEEAFRRGAHAALISDESSIPENASNLIIVDDVISSLHRLAAAWRQGLDAIFVGITGTCGKTTTRSLLFHLLEDEMEVYSALENYNTEIGLPLALLGMPRSAKVGIYELGTIQPGEIKTLAGLLACEIAVITLAGRGHLTGFGDVESVANEKWDLIRALPERGKAFVNVDSPALARLAEACNARIKTVGLSTADLSARISYKDSGLVIDTEKPKLHLETRLLGTHNATNALLAVAVALELGMKPQAIEERIKSFPPFAHRLNLVKAAFGYILDDSYNANPESMRAALMTLAGLKLPVGRKAFVFGDMLDLGKNSPDYHDEVIALALQLGISPIFPVGELTTEAAQRASLSECFVLCKKHDLKACITASLAGSPSVLLVKGSHDMGLTRVVEQLSTPA
jgi:UDP-N-acetylmuramoyl-tripeptide--D-alanyl-D-alanine ligase